MQEEKNSPIHLRPRFRIEMDSSQDDVLNKFKANLADGECRYCSKIVDGHVVIDVPVEENHFWSPQLNIEVEKLSDERSVVKGLFGPKPQVWTLFMFFHFAVAVAFIGFGVLAYVNWSLGRANTFPMVMVIGLPIIWVVMYVLGRIGKKTGHDQMEELHDFMIDTLEK